MKLCYLIPEFPGMTHVIFWREMRRLREAGVAVTVASSKRPPAAALKGLEGEPVSYTWPPSSAALTALPSFYGLRQQLGFALRLPEGGWRERLTVLSMLPSAWTLAAHLRAEKVDHIHVQSFANAAYLAALAHLATRIPYSLVLHGGISVYGLNHAAKLHHCLFACGVSPGTRAEIEAVYPGKVLAQDIQCGVDLELYRPRARPVDGPLRLVTVGRLHHCKGIGFALEALAEVRQRAEVTYTLVGGGPHEADIRAHVGRLGLDDVVTFLPPRGQDEIAALLLEHHVAVLTSTGAGEATATSIREAMTTGMPVIMSRIGEAERMVEPGVDGFITEQEDVAGIARAISWYASHREELPRMSEAARRRAERDFDDRIGPRRLMQAVNERLAAYPARSPVTDALPA